MKAMVVGGFTRQISGGWSRMLQTSLGIEVGYVCGSDNEFRGLPTDALPADVDIVLVATDSVSHRASNQARWLASKKGVRCELVSLNASRTVEMLLKRGYQKPAPVLVTTAEQAAVPQVVAPPPPPPTPEVEWLDAGQVRELLPHMKTTTFYELVRTVVTREPRKEQREVVRSLNGRSYTTKLWMMVWTMEEVVAIEAEARKRGIWDKPAPLPVEAPAPVEEAPEVVLAVEPEATHGLRFDPNSLSVCLSELHAAAMRVGDAVRREAGEVDALRQELAEVKAERDALRARLEGIRSALAL